MANPSRETTEHPFTAFRFAVEIEIPGVTANACHGAFAECDGVELTLDVKTIREGGNNAAPIRLTGPMSLGTVTLKRGMTANFDLWDWLTALQEEGNGKLRATTKIVVMASDGTENARFVLKRCLPIKLKAPALNAKDGMVAVEELQMVYESLELVKPRR